MNIKVSIIIPVYNSDKYLEQCLNSVIEQKFKSIEIIVVNDASTDNSLEIMKKYQIKDDRIVLVNLEERRGVANARNKGLECARGEYISFIDSDDWVSKDYVGFLYEEIEKEKADMVSTSFYFYDDVTKGYKEYKISQFYCNNDFSTIKQKKRIVSNPSFEIVVWSKIYNKKFLINNNFSFVELKGKEDVLFSYEVFLLANKLKFVNNPIYFYRINRGISLSVIPKTVLFFNIKVLKKIKLLLMKRKVYDTYALSFLKFCLGYLADDSVIDIISMRKSKILLLSLKRSLQKADSSLLNRIIGFPLYVFLGCSLIQKEIIKCIRFYSKIRSFLK